MKTKKSLLILFMMAIIPFLLVSSCKRSDIEESSPFGPSTFAVLLNLSTSTNILFAGNTREVTIITAALKKYDGVALAGKTVHFKIGDEAGNKLNIGYFDDQQSVATKVTNSNGVVSVNYYGPLARELLQNALIYIWATVAGDGKEFISEMTPVQLICDATDLLFEVGASPNVLYATQVRPLSEIKAIVKYGPTPVVNRRVYFSILEGPGEFSDNKRKTFAVTDENGIATVTYIGPTKGEIAGDLFAVIRGHLETSSLEEYSYKEVYIRIIKSE